jgi:hypothetical protein
LFGTCLALDTFGTAPMTLSPTNHRNREGRYFFEFFEFLLFLLLFLFLRRFALLVRRAKKRVNDMNYTVRGLDVGDDDLDGIVQVNDAILDGHSEIFTQQGGGTREVDQVRRRDFAADNVVEEDVRQLQPVLREEQVVGGTGGQSCEGVISRGENSEGTLSF